MSFGFSVSDIVGCARLAYRLYDEFRQAPGAFQEFSRELLLFHQVLMKTGSTASQLKRLGSVDQAALNSCLDSCKELLYVQIMGAPIVPEALWDVGVDWNSHKADFLIHSHLDKSTLFHNWHQRFGARKFALRIPKLQNAISSHIEKLNILLAQTYQSENRDFQERINERVGESQDLLVEFSTNHALQLDSISDRLGTSQARIESQLQAILANQQRSNTPITSQSLDASSPEGRQTWMELGRLLRHEGITPAVIQENRRLLINAMKDTLRCRTLVAESIPQSYATAPEYHTDNYISSSLSQPINVSRPDIPPVSSSMPILGSAPPRSLGFTAAFLERQNSAAISLDRKQNVNDGMRSLFQGMNRDNLTPEFELGDGEF